MWKKELRKYDVNENVFNNILDTFSDKLKIVENFNDYKFGYKGTDLEKSFYTMAYDGSQWLVMPEFVLQYITNTSLDCDNTWRQCIVRLTREQTTEVEVGVNGYYAYNYMMKALKTYYTKDEIEKRLYMFEAEYDENNIQEHYVLSNRNELLEFENCYKYDINSAHASALLEIFPKAEELIRNLYDKRKEYPKYKAIMNYFVGYLCCVKHRKTYNWIVQRTTKILRNAVNTTGGTIIYANTDGFIVQNPDINLNTSKIIGEFKEEYKGIVRFYKDKNWFVYELEQEKDHHKRTLALEARDYVSLKDRQIVHYDKIKPQGKHNFEIINITKEIV